MLVFISKDGKTSDASLVGLEEVWKRYIRRKVKLKLSGEKQINN